MSSLHYFEVLLQPLILCIMFSYVNDTNPHLMLDHFNVSINKNVFNTLKPIFQSIKGALFKESHFPHGSWKGLYFVPTKGAIVEFTEEDKNDPSQQLQLYFKSSKKDLYLNEFLRINFRDINWKTNHINFQNGEKWFDSTLPDLNDNYFYLSFIDFSTKGLKRRNSLSNIIGNVFCSIKELNIDINEACYEKILSLDLLSDLITYKNSVICINTLHSKNTFLKIFLHKMKDNYQRINLKMQMDKSFRLPSIKNDRLSFNVKDNILTLEFFN